MPLVKFTIDEKKGDITFYKGSNGKLYQRIGLRDMIPVKNGAMGYTLLQRVLGYSIKYNLNGVHGFSVWEGKRMLEDNIWTFDAAMKVAKEFGTVGVNP